MCNVCRDCGLVNLDGVPVRGVTSRVVTNDCLSGRRQDLSHLVYHNDETYRPHAVFVYANIDSSQDYFPLGLLAPQGLPSVQGFVHQPGLLHPR